MAAKRKFKSDAFEAAHSAVAGMDRAGTIDKATLRDFDETCLAVTPPMAPAEIKQLRETNKVSQPVFARYLNTSGSTVEKWETGAKKPSGAALELLSIVRKHGLRILASADMTLVERVAPLAFPGGQSRAVQGAQAHARPFQMPLTSEG
jgi:putative transcriptional regulator